jgi:hypothetical protein
MQLKQHTTPCASVNTLFTGRGRKGYPARYTLLWGPDVGIFPKASFTTFANAGYLLIQGPALFLLPTVAGIGARRIPPKRDFAATWALLAGSDPARRRLFAV